MYAIFSPSIVTSAALPGCKNGCSAVGAYSDFPPNPRESSISSTTPFNVKKSHSPYIPSVICILSSGNSVNGNAFGI